MNSATSTSLGGPFLNQFKPPNAQELCEGHSYVRNRFTNLQDPSSLQDDDEEASVECKVRVCLNPVGGTAGALGGHLYIVLERPANGETVEWAYRGGPGGATVKRGEGCDCTNTKYGQLVGDHGEYKEGFVDYVPPEDENCKSVLVEAPDCEKVHDCFINTLRLIDECCMTYEPVPPPLGLGKKCNSNCVVGWTLTNCIAPRGLIGAIPLPIGRITPGVLVPRPRCIREPQPKKTGTANKVSCAICAHEENTPS